MKKYFAEFLGTFILVFIACGAASFTGGYTGYLGVVGIALIFGLTVTAVSYGIGSVSGAHINPAVSFAMLLTKRMKFIDFMGYVVAQMLGGIAGAFALYGLAESFNTDTLSQYQAYGYDLVGLGTNGFGKQSAFLQVNVWGAFVMEAVLTCIFVLAVLGVTAKAEYQKVAGIVIGFALTCVHLFGIPFTGTGVNPARSFGPALVKAIFGNVTALSQVWVFIVAPLAGALCAALLYLLFAHEKKAKAVDEEGDIEDIALEEVEG